MVKENFDDLVTQAKGLVIWKHTIDFKFEFFGVTIWSENYLAAKKFL